MDYNKVQIFSLDVNFCLFFSYNHKWVILSTANRVLRIIMNYNSFSCHPHFLSYVVVGLSTGTIISFPHIEHEPLLLDTSTINLQMSPNDYSVNSSDSLRYHQLKSLAPTLVEGNQSALSQLKSALQLILNFYPELTISHAVDSKIVSFTSFNDGGVNRTQSNSLSSTNCIIILQRWPMIHFILYK